MYVAQFALWTLLTYWFHRGVHRWPYLHREHHGVISGGDLGGWRWANLFLFFDSWTITIDQWSIEVVPLLITCWVFDSWWLALGYYLFGALVQEWTLHNPRYSAYPFLAGGRWHLVHHCEPQHNFSLIFPLWDWVFRTNKWPTASS